MNIRNPRAPRRSRGFTLIELMVSVTIGMIVVLTVLAAFIGSGIGGRHTSALGQMTEDASLALNVIRSQVAMAGYSAPTGINTAATGPSLLRNFGQEDAIFGCDDGFSDITEASLALLSCGSTVGPDALNIRYEVDNFNAIATSAGGAPAVPTDCEGNQIALVGGFRLAEARFYVANGELFCKGNGTVGGSGLAMVGNIQDLRLTYGVSSAAFPNQVVAYVSGSDAPLSETDKALWSRVMSVRICVVVRSENQVLDAVTDYFDCTGAPQTPADRRMYRAFTTTVVLYNRATGHNPTN